MDGRELALSQPVAATLTGDEVTHVIFILDRSGSMSGKAADVIGGFNSYVDALRAEPKGQVGVSYVRFDHETELVWNDLPLADVPQMTADTYRVRGNTALLDAVGMTVSAVREDPAHAYIVITNTDGEENASREWTVDGVKELIARYEAKGNFSFAFFGEGIDAWSQASDMGYAPTMAAAYTAHEAGAMYRAKARATNIMRSRKMRSSRDFGAATRMAMDRPDATDDEIASALEGAPARKTDR
jgi:Mg-chelatase subunit ChlD